ncbi:SAM-dependent methyltransferase [Actinomycetota bacterium Odt1-20B]
MSDSSANEDSWARYGRVQLDRGYLPPVPERITWGPWPGVGPGAEVLGEIRGKRLLDIGCGPGHHAVHLARAHGAQVDAVDLSPTQHERALRRSTPGVRFLHADVVDHLRNRNRNGNAKGKGNQTPYDAAYAIGTLGCVDPHHVLPALRDHLADGAAFVFSALHTNLDGAGPRSTVAPRPEMIRLRDTPPIPLQMWVLTPQLWEDLLTDTGFLVEAVDLLHAPTATGSPVIHQLIRARRHFSLSSHRSCRT